MAVTLTVAQLAARLRLGDGTAAPAEPVASILAEYLELATDIVEEYAAAAPDSAHNVAATRFCGYVYDSPTAAAGNLFSNALDNSGAAGILSRYRVRRATIVDDGGNGSAAIVPQTGGLDLAQVTSVVNQLLAVHAGLATVHHEPISLASLMVALVGAEITGSTLTFTRASGTNPISLTLPSGTGVADGTVTSAVINEATNVITLTRSVGSALTLDLSYLVAAAGLNMADVDARIKTFARFGSTVKPTPADLAPNPANGRVLGVSTQGGTLKTGWLESSGDGTGGGLPVVKQAIQAAATTLGSSVILATPLATLPASNFVAGERWLFRAVINHSVAADGSMTIRLIEQGGSLLQELSLVFQEGFGTGSQPTTPVLEVLRTMPFSRDVRVEAYGNGAGTLAAGAVRLTAMKVAL